MSRRGGHRDRIRADKSTSYKWTYYRLKLATIDANASTVHDTAARF